MRVLIDANLGIPLPEIFQLIFPTGYVFTGIGSQETRTSDPEIAKRAKKGNQVIWTADKGFSGQYEVLEQIRLGVKVVCYRGIGDSTLAERTEQILATMKKVEEQLSASEKNVAVVVVDRQRKVKALTLEECEAEVNRRRNQSQRDKAKKASNDDGL